MDNKKIDTNIVWAPWMRIMLYGADCLSEPSKPVEEFDSELTELAHLLLKDGGYDEYLESEGTLWLLHYQLQKVGYSSIYSLAFNQFF